MSLQRDIFKESEDDAWYKRNEQTLTSRDWSQDSICIKLSEILDITENVNILEIGCGNGARLKYLAENHNCTVFGIDPSAEAVFKANVFGISALQATADNLPYSDCMFDIVIFGFCLYLCNDSDLFRIAQEADRVLKSKAWLLILDFDSPSPIYREYHHRQGVRSRKMDCKSLFTWHPAYTIVSQQKFHHETQQWTDNPNHWVNLSCLRKSLDDES